MKDKFTNIVRIAIVQTDPVFGDVQHNISEVLTLMKTSKADIYVLPELFNTGYNFISRDELGNLAEPSDGKTCSELRKFSEENNCCVVFGFAESENDLIYNSAALVGPKGLKGIYRKIHLYNRENIFFSRGNLGFPVFDTPFGKIGIMICFDWLFPEAARTLSLRGAQLIVHPSNLVLPHCPDAMVTRCLENRIFSATANRIGTEDRGGYKFNFIGKSEIVSPNGEILSRLPDAQPTIAVVSVDLSKALNKRLNEFNDIFQDLADNYYKFDKNSDTDI